jgi:uncharacterized protein involved in copper resistance
MKRPKLLLLATIALGWVPGCVTSPPKPAFSLSDAANANAPEGTPPAIPTLKAGAEALLPPPATHQMEMDHSGHQPSGMENMEHMHHGNSKETQ